MQQPPLIERVALVTGGARRIGRSISLALAGQGADVVVNYFNSKVEVGVVIDQIRATGRRAEAIQADVSRREAVQKMIAMIEDQFGRLDILVNNAGVFFPVSFEALTDAQWDGILATNLKSQFLCSQLGAPLLRKHGRGRIINLASLGGILPWPAYTHYCVSKAGVIMLTKCLARALAPEITVNCIAPGTIQFEGESPDDEYVTRAPLRRTGSGDDIARTVLYLAESDFVTGQVIAVDGGRSLT